MAKGGESMQDKPVPTGRDLTTCKEAKGKLTNREELFQALTENILDVVVLDVNGNIRYRSPLFDHMFGEGPRELHPFKLVHRDDRKIAVQALSQLMHNPRDPVRVEIRGQHRDNSWHHFEVLARNFLDNPAVAGIVSTFHDITERKMAEAALNERLRFDRLLAELSTKFINLPDAEVDKQIDNGLKLVIEFLDVDRSTLFQLSEDKVRFDVTHSWAVSGIEPVPIGISSDLFPYCAEKVLRGEIFMFSRPDDLPDESGDEKQLILLNGIKANLTIPLKVGGSVLGAVAFGSFRSERTWPDELVQRLQLVADIFANALVRKLADEELRRAYSELEMRVEERTAALRKSNEELQIEIAEREQAEEEKQKMEQRLQLAARLATVGELVAGIAHELNNPLAAVQAYAQFLAGRDDIEQTMKSDVETIYREAQRATRITGNLLSFARRHKPEKSLVSINEIIQKSIELHARQMKVNRIDLVVELDADLPMIMADPHQMEQVFVNIIANAYQAMIEEHGKGELIIRTENMGGAVQVSFTDNGPGISAENLNRIFDPFFTAKKSGKGTGLGLSISFGIVYDHGGHLYASSDGGRGTTFFVELPIVSAGQAVDDGRGTVQPD